MREGQVARDPRAERGFACVGIWLWTRREGELGRVRLSVRRQRVGGVRERGSEPGTSCHKLEPQR